MKENTFYDLPKAGFIKRFLWKCAGGDKFLLERATYSDQVKYLCLGGIVLATGVMAGLAGGYAFYTIFSPKTAEAIDRVKMVDGGSEIPTDLTTVLLAIFFGVIWGLIIFNIDRFIVTSTGKGDGTEKITKEEFLSAIPRILMGAIIAITISKPVEIRMFKSEIDAKIYAYQQEKMTEAVKQVEANFEAKVKRANDKIIDTKAKIKEKIEILNDLSVQIARETTGQNNNGAGFGQRAKALTEQKEMISAEINSLKNTQAFKDAQSDIRKYELQKQNEIKKAEKKAASEDGLLRRIKLADAVAGEKEDGTQGFPWITLFITLLFLAIELTPVFFKLMLIKTPYDYLADNRDDLIKANNGIEVRYNYYQDKKGLERHLVINHDAQDLLFEKQKLSEIQKELTDYALEKYKQREKEKIDDNLDDYVKSL